MGTGTDRAKPCFADAPEDSAERERWMRGLISKDEQGGRGQYTDWKERKELEPIFELLSDGQLYLSEESVRLIVKVTGAPRMTVRDWSARVLRDGAWRPPAWFSGNAKTKALRLWDMGKIRDVLQRFYWNSSSARNWR